MGEPSSSGRRVRPKLILGSNPHTNTTTTGKELALLTTTTTTTSIAATTTTRSAAVKKNSSPPLPLLRDGLCQFVVLLPCRARIVLRLPDDDRMMVVVFLGLVKTEAAKLMHSSSKGVKWGPHCFLQDSLGHRVRDGELFLSDFPRTLLLQDGSPSPTYSLSDMWDVTPEPQMLGNLPVDYTLETALADLLDNSLQAVWRNSPNERRLISVTIKDEKITIFDTGLGMDSTKENSIAKWGTMGSSSHRAMRSKAIGGEPPFLKPFFGMYGYGGLVATMHLGGLVVVSSKTKSSKKVVTLTLEREALVKTCKSNRIWKTPGELRDANGEEFEKSPHGSFTQVDISKLKEHRWKDSQIKCMLKDIYFPYIQCDYNRNEKRTLTPVEFEVNGTNLIEVEGGEVVVTNLASCNGPTFVLNLHLKRNRYEAGRADRANARITCLYFPIIQGTESIDLIIEKLQKQEMDRNEDFEHFCRVSVRNLGRLLPDARWARIPFMQPKRKRSQKIEFPQECYKRVKAFIDTDAGFTPSPSKTDLLNRDVFTVALRNLGSTMNAEQIQDTTVQILRERRTLSIQQLDKEFGDWIKTMHENFDEDIYTDSESVTIVNAEAAKQLGLSQEVFRVHKKIRRHGHVWHANSRVKILKGIPGHHQDLFATLEFFVSEGLENDSGETKIVCRPIDIPKVHGSKLEFLSGNPVFDLGRSKALLVDILSSGRCEPVDDDVWRKKEEKILQSSPGFIEILDSQKARIFGVEMGFPPKGKIEAGSKVPALIMAVVRPKKFLSLVKEGKNVESVDRKSIVNEAMEMRLEVQYCSPSGSSFAHQGLESVTNPTTKNNISGIYCFSTEGNQLQNIFRRAGTYVFIFSLRGIPVDPETIEVSVLPSKNIGYWRLHNHPKYCDNVHRGLNISLGKIRLGCKVGPLFITCYDEFENIKILDQPPSMHFEVWSKRRQCNADIEILTTLPHLTEDRMNLVINEVTFVGGSCENLRPDFEALLKICILDSFYADMQIELLPGEIYTVRTLEVQDLDNHFKPGDIIRDFVLKAEDAYGNNVEMGQPLQFNLNGVQFQDNQMQYRKVDENGCVILGGLLKVVGPFNSKARILVLSQSGKELYQNEFCLLRRQLHVKSEIPEECSVGSMLENVVIHFLDENNEVDWEIDGSENMLMLEINGKRSVYPIEQGVCCIKSIHLPYSPGMHSLRFMHCAHQELFTEMEVALFPTMMALPDIENFEPTTQTQPQNCFTTPTETETEIETDRRNREPEHTKQWEKKCSASDLQKYKRKLEQIQEEIKLREQDKQKTQECVSQIEDDIKHLDQKLNNISENTPNLTLPISDSSEGGRTYASVLSRIKKLDHPVSPFLEPQCYKEKDEDISGVVALLGSLENGLLSSILSEFIGKKDMLSLVCKTEEKLENYDLDMAKRRGKNVQSRLRVYVLSKMRVYKDGCTNGKNPQNLLNIPEPMLRDGTCPTGFLGYAVNVIILSQAQLKIKISKDGYGLRESLFYNLFDKLQIYDTVKNLHAAREVLTSGGVSLDGGLIRDGACIEIGAREEGKICFPVERRGDGDSMLRRVDAKSERMQISIAADHKKQEMEKTRSLMKQINNKIEELVTKSRYYRGLMNIQMPNMDKMER